MSDAGARTFLLEVGVEELPARFCAGALEQLRAKGESLLAEARLSHGATAVLGTPRRLAWTVADCAARQADAEVVARGPSRAAAYDAEGRPTAAALGFARAQGVPVESLSPGEAGGREYVFARRVAAGRPAAEVLGDLVPRLVAALDFPRAMRWGDLDFRFPRPIRWLVCLLDADVVAAEVAGVAAGRRTFGHRTLSPGALDIAHALDYVELLRRAHVMVDRDERRLRIASEAGRAAAEGGGRLRPHAGLLDELTDINEWPTGFHGGFDPDALRVPEPVLVTVMRLHQRYFPVEDGSGSLLPRFVGIRNGGPHGMGNVVAGNEKVLAARFADARFFYDEDRKRTLRSRLPGLAQVGFAEGLGTLADKSERLAQLVGGLAEAAGGDRQTAIRAAELCKADRLTHVVNELPELEGTMGEHYAVADGEPREVAAAIAGHVLPRAAGDDLPDTPAGQALAVADRLDSLAGHFLRGRAPTGSADPFGLRRAATAVVRILMDCGWDLDLADAVAQAVQGYGDRAAGAAGTPGETSSAIFAFLGARLRAQLEEAGHRPDVVDAVTAAGARRPRDVAARCAALTAAIAAPSWGDASTAFRRAGHLARQGEPAADVDPSLLRHPAESRLFDALVQARRAATAAAARGDHAGVLAATAALREPVDAFLTDVLAMDPDPATRRNRLALLRGVADLPVSVADLGRLAGA